MRDNGYPARTAGALARLGRRFAGFARAETGAATVEYAAMAAAAVALGLATTVAVRNGVGTWAGASGSSLSGNAMVATALPSGGGTLPGNGGPGYGAGPGDGDISYPVSGLPAYSLRHYDQNTFNSLLTWVRADFDNATVSQEYTYQVSYLLQNPADTQLARETLDWIYVMAYELTRRGLGYPNGSMTFEQVTAAYDAAISAPITPPTRGPRTAPTR
jgi:Flp pilus assembly pilin Flp